MISLVPRVSGITGALPGAAATDGGSAYAAAGNDFGSMLTGLVSNASQTLAHAETLSIAGLQGKASVQQVADSVMAAQQTLQTALAVRDKAVAAYQDLSRMAI